MIELRAAVIHNAALFASEEAMKKGEVDEACELDEAKSYGCADLAHGCISLLRSLNFDTADAM